MRYTDQPPLPNWIRDAYETLEPEFSPGTAELSRADAQEILLAEDESIEEDADAVRAIDRLLDCGWLYEVDDRLRKTE